MRPVELCCAILLTSALQEVTTYIKDGQMVFIDVFLLISISY